MTYDFNVYPCGGRVSFVRAKLDEVKQMMTDYPQDWNSYPGGVKNPTNNVFQLIHEGRTSPQDWPALLLPQNYDVRVLYIDVDHPDWIAVVHDDRLRNNIVYGSHWYRYQHLGIQESTGPLGVEEIRINYLVRSPHPEYDGRNNGTFLYLNVYSTESSDVEGIRSRSYISEEPWVHYGIGARGFRGFEGLDAPIIRTLTDEEMQQLPVELRANPVDNFDYISHESFFSGSEDEIVEAFYPYLPFDVRGCKRVPECISLARIDSWLNETFGIRWNDPSFYDGDSLLYHLSEPGGFKDFFKPRIPVEKFYDMRGIDHDYIRDLVARGKL